jgi:excisionase family DNA binding protein
MSISARVSQIEWLDARRFEEVFSLSKRTFFAWIADGRLTAYRPSARKTLVRKEDVVRVLEASKAAT